ncbi:hypothetical protein BgiBS90_018313 [Biomphalaria glabrata]|nr:hypothetical protein BgiBS90_018313 [Biomphalaria glabrata]
MKTVFARDRNITLVDLTSSQPPFPFPINVPPLRTRSSPTSLQAAPASSGEEYAWPARDVLDRGIYSAVCRFANIHDQLTMTLDACLSG